MKNRPPSFVRIALMLGLLGSSAALAFEAGGVAFTKRVETKLLTEPRPLASPAGKLGYRKKVKVEEVRAGWLRVSEGPNTGWVFAGNLASTQPDESKGLDGLPLTASATTATAAARPLTPAAAEYAARRNLANAQDDLTWLLEQSDAVTEEKLVEFLQAEKKGDYR